VPTRSASFGDVLTYCSDRRVILTMSSTDGYTNNIQDGTRQAYHRRALTDGHIAFPSRSGVKKEHPALPPRPQLGFTVVSTGPFAVVSR